MKKIVIVAMTFMIFYSNAYAYTSKQEETIAQIVIVSSIAVSLCNEKELPNLDYRGSKKVFLSLLMRYQDILERLNPLYVKAIEKKLKKMNLEEKYKFCMDLFKTAPGLFEDRESGKLLGERK